MSYSINDQPVCLQVIQCLSVSAPPHSSMQQHLGVPWRDVLTPSCYISSTKQLHMHWRNNNISTDSFLIQIRDSPADLLSVHTVCQQSTSAIGAGISNLQSSSRRSYSLFIHIMYISFFRLHGKIYRLWYGWQVFTLTHIWYTVCCSIFSETQCSAAQSAVCTQDAFMWEDRNLINACKAKLINFIGRCNIIFKIFLSGNHQYYRW